MPFSDGSQWHELDPCWRATIVISSVTTLFSVIGVFLPLVAQRLLKPPNRELIQCMLMETAFCCWLFWLCCYLAQLNPLIGPKLDSNHLLAIAREWNPERFALKCPK